MFSEGSQGGESGRRGQRRRSADGLLHQGRVPEATNLPPCKARPDDLAEPGAAWKYGLRRMASRTRRAGLHTPLKLPRRPAAIKGVFMLDYGRIHAKMTPTVDSN